MASEALSSSFGASRGARRLPISASTSQRRARLAVSPLRGLQLGLGLLWLLDAALQYQPFMFGRSFVTEVIAPTAAGNPYVVAHSVTWAARLMVQHIAVYNAVFASIQLLLALGIFFRPTVRLALAASIGWALAVWWFGEGLGGALLGATPVMGGPGGVVLYAVIAVLVWPRHAGARDGTSISPATGGLVGERGAQLLWLVLWGSFTWYLLLPGNRAPRALGADLVGMADGEPGWIQGIERHLGQAVAHSGTGVSIVVAVLCALVALGVWSRASLRPAVLVAAALGLAFWVAEAFGEIFTGQGTDPNSGLPLMLLAACYWPFARQAASTEAVGSDGAT